MPGPPHSSASSERFHHTLVDRIPRSESLSDLRTNLIKGIQTTLDANIETRNRHRPSRRSSMGRLTHIRS